MLDKIRKFSSGIPAKIMMFIIAIPFVLWGMGSVFRSGNQNTIATIDSKNISIDQFLNYVRAADPDLDEFRSNPQSTIMEKLYYDFISNKILMIEAKNNNINISDDALAKIIKSQKLFMKDGKFSRAKYEKFLIERNIPATYFEKKYSEQEIKRLFFSLISDGFIAPSFYVNENYNKRNKSLDISYINLENYYNKEMKTHEMKEFLNANKENFQKKYITIKYLELLPEALTGDKEFSKLFFEKIDEIDELIVNEGNIDEISKKYNLKYNETALFNNSGEVLDSKSKIQLNQNKISQIFKNVDKKLFLLDIENNYILVEIVSKKNILPSIEDKNVKDNISRILKIKEIVDKNNSIRTKIENNKFKKIDFKNFAQENNLTLKKTKISNVNDIEVFEQDVLSKVFGLYNGDIKIISDKSFSKNYLILVNNIYENKIDELDQHYTLNSLEAELAIKNSIFNIYDQYLKNKYKVETNQKVFEKVKNYFR